MHQKQIDRLINKMKQLTNIYQKYVIVSEMKINEVYYQDKLITDGTYWGKDFEYGTFRFTVPKLKNEKYYIFCLTGSTEHLIKVNGREVGMLDYVPNAMDDIFRIHKYLYLENLKEEDQVVVEGYFSHKIPGTFPYHKGSVFALNTYDYDRPFRYISLVTMDDDLKELVKGMNRLNQLYDTTNNTKKKECYFHIYKSLFSVLSLKDERPSKESVLKGLEILSSLSSIEDATNYIGVIGHSHLDTAWLWTVEETRHKMHRTISNAVTLCKRYPDYKFFFSTVLYLKWLKEDDIKLYNDVIELIKQGKIEANGASFIEFDSNLIGNESICKQFIRGIKFLEEEAGYSPDVFWLPDTFGYAASLPQILKQVRIPYFLTTKLSWNDTNTFPYDTFKWIGIDGSSVDVHFTSIQTWIDPVSIKERLKGVIDKTTTTDVLMTYGFGDGGGGPSSEMVERAIDTCNNYKEYKVEHTTVSDFMKKVTNKELPSYFGELYLELHRGTYTSIHDIKKYHKALEVAIHDIEMLNVLANDKSNQDLINKNIDVLLLNEFHDILPGTCIKEANEIAVTEMKDAINELKEIMGKGNYFNPLFIPVDTYINDGCGQSYIGLDGEKKSVSFYHFEPASIGYRKACEGCFTYDNGVFTTPIYQGKIEEGIITSLRWNNQELVDGKMNYFKVCENYPFIYDNWDIDADFSFKEQNVTFVSQELLTIGASLLIVRVKNKFFNSMITTDICFHNNDRIVEFKNKIEICDDHLLLHTYFDTTIFNSKYRSEIQFGYVERNSHHSSHEDEAKFETCSHKWVDLSNHSMGISLLKEDIYGTSCNKKRLGLTLHKGGTHPDSRSDKGIHYINYALFPHLNDLSMETIEASYKYSYKPIETKYNPLDLLKIKYNDSCVIETLKYSYDNKGIIIRIYEALGGNSKLNILLNKEYNIIETNILEEELINLGCSKELSLDFKPFEIKTILLK